MVEALTQGVAKLFGGGGSTKEVDQNLLATTPQSHVKWDNSKKMLAAQWSGTKTVKVADHDVPLISHPRDAIVRMTTVTICGSDLHLYLNALPVSGAMKSGDIMGHEGVGIVEAVGDEVKDFKAGDRVVVSAVISCGDCQYCKSQQPSLCDRTNPSKQCEDLYGQRLAGIFGYSHLVGGYSGMQAEYLRVPCADNTLLKLPQTAATRRPCSCRT
jgi:threonine dehydrogenase-like Zn-dependent dehydrogenase